MPSSFIYRSHRSTRKNVTDHQTLRFSNSRQQSLVSILVVYVVVWSLAIDSSWLRPTTNCNKNKDHDHHHLLHPTETFETRRHSTKEQEQQQGGLSNQAKAAWCPQATCPVSAICHPCKRRYLIILAAGRSGSTTLLCMLNSLPGIRLSGENNGVLHNFQHAIGQTRMAPQWKAASLDAWSHLPVTPSNFACVTQQMVEVLTPPPAAPEPEQAPNHDQDHDDDHGTIVGFKTVRFPQIPQSTTVESRWNLLREAAVFLNETFPCGRFIISIRNPLERAKSAKRVFGIQETLPTVVRESHHLNQNLLDLATMLGGPQRWIILNSSEWTQNITIVNDMVSSWLGFDKACHFDQLFELNTHGYGYSYGYGRGNVTNRTRVPPGCNRLPF